MRLLAPLCTLARGTELCGAALKINSILFSVSSFIVPGCDRYIRSELSRAVYSDTIEVLQKYSQSFYIAAVYHATKGAPDHEGRTGRCGQPRIVRHRERDNTK